MLNSRRMLTVSLLILKDKKKAAADMQSPFLIYSKRITL